MVDIIAGNTTQGEELNREVGDLAPSLVDVKNPDVVQNSKSSVELDVDIVSPGLPDVDIDILTEKETDVDVLIEVDAARQQEIPKVYSSKSEFLEILKPAIKIPSIRERFYPKKHFRIDTRRNAEVPISCLWEEFKYEFLERETETRPGYVVTVSRLRKTAMHHEILGDIGFSHEIDLAGLYYIMHRFQVRRDEDGDAMNSIPVTGIGFPNGFFIKNRFGESRFVFMSWINGGWNIGSRQISPGWGLSFGNVFHRNPLFGNNG